MSAATPPRACARLFCTAWDSIGAARWCRPAVRLLVAALLASAATSGCARGGGGRDLEPVDPYEAVVKATEEHALVALGEYHLMTEWHDFMAELLRRPALATSVDDLVVEFGNALYQDVADRYLLDLDDVPAAELAQTWRNTIGGRVLWDAPVYEQFFRNVRAANEKVPRPQRFRVLLGDPDVDFARVTSAADTAELSKADDRDSFFADVVEREVLDRGRRAILIAGADHLRRNVHANSGSGDPNVATLLERAHPGELFIVYPLPFGYSEEARQRVEDDFEDAPRPALAHLPGTWLGRHEVADRALEPNLTFAEQVDAVLWFGRRETLTASRADPDLYRSGEYAAELRRRSAILSDYFGEPIDYVAEGLRLATSGSNLEGP
jgi:hypothetical protein